MICSMKISALANPNINFGSDVNNEDELDKAIVNTEGYDNLDDCVDAINNILHVCQVDEAWAENSDGIEYYDDYLAELDGYKE